MLFADRARRVDAGFVLDDQTGPVVAGLVRRLDGMPDDRPSRYDTTS